MDMNRGLNRTDHYHICHVDTDRLENGTASIITFETRTREEKFDAIIDTQGFFRNIDNGRPLNRDMVKPVW